MTSSARWGWPGSPPMPSLKLVVIVALTLAFDAGDLTAQVPTAASQTRSGTRLAGVERTARSRGVIGAIGGAVLGGLAGYFITSEACRRCDDPAPLLLGTTVGAVAGASIGIVIASRATSATSMRPTSAGPRDRVVTLVVRFVR